MTYRITAVLLDNSLVDPKPTLIECEATNWYEATDMIVETYALSRGGKRNIDFDRIELKAISMTSVPDEPFEPVRPTSDGPPKIETDTRIVRQG